MADGFLLVSKIDANVEIIVPFEQNLPVNSPLQNQPIDVPEPNAISQCNSTFGNRCKFPFWYKDRFHFECVRHDNSPSYDCLVDKESWEPCCEESCPLMKFHLHEELISDLESIQEVATDQFAEIFCLTDDVSIP